MTRERIEQQGRNAFKPGTVTKNPFPFLSRERRWWQDAYHAESMAYGKTLLREYDEWLQERSGNDNAKGERRNASRTDQPHC